MSPDPADPIIVVEVHKTVTINDKDTGQPVIDLTNRDGLVSIKKRSQTYTKVRLVDLDAAIKALAT